MEPGRLEAGCDEAGRGPLAGPVYAAAVILPPDFFHPLLDDSKKMTEKAREELRPIIEREAVAWAVENGITTGTSPTTFSPDKNCTREQVVTFLWRTVGCPEPESSDMPFNDVKEGKYYYDAVLWAYQNDITTGVSPDRFGVGSECTREQVVTFLYRTARYAGMPEYEGTTDFSDVPEGKYYYIPVAWAYDNGITTGTSPTTFGVKKPCVRGMIVTFLKRYDDRY